MSKRAFPGLALVLAGCAGTPAPTGGAMATGASGEPGASAPAPATSTEAAGPVNLTFTADTARSAAGTVTTERGGTVTAIAADGTTFELAVPAFAVGADTEIRLTPLADVHGIDAAGPSHAVQLEPEGLQFLQLVRLTIQPAAPIAPASQVMIEANGDGSDARLALVDPTTTGIVLLFEHFTIGDATTLTDEQKALFKKKSATNAQRQLEGEIRDRIQEERDKQLAGEDPDPALWDDLEALFDRFEKEVVEKLGEAAALSCDALGAYVKALLSFHRQLELVGLGSTAALDRFIAAIRTIADERYPECEREAIDRCRDKKEPQILIDFWVSFQFAQKGAEPKVDAAMQRRAENLCDPKGLQFHFAGEGTGSYTGFPGAIQWEYWGLLCPDATTWQVWELVDDEAGSESTGTPDQAAYGPLEVTFDSQGTMTGATWPPLGRSPAGYLLHKTRLTLTPGDEPTKVDAVISAGQVDLSATAPVEPWDGSFGSCERQ